jgi:O-methyltransferase
MISQRDKCIAPQEDVKKLFDSLGISGNSEIVPGWFKDSLPIYRDKIGPIALLHIDGDYHESVTDCLENLYDNVSSGGYVVLDDYGFWEGCRKALHEFLERRSINPRIVKIDSTGVYFVKP